METEAAAARWECGRFSFDLSSPVLMGILNVTPDSFSDGGAHDGFEQAVAHARGLVDAGAQVVDVGGESTRPGSAEVSPAEELRRVVPVVKRLSAAGVAVSVDTRHAAVAEAALAAGACIINDVSGFRDGQMRELVAASSCGVVAMHMLGEPRSMQDAPRYADVVGEVEGFLLDAARALEARGVAPERICLDPGVGFGKTFEHNRALLEATPRLAALGYPLMVAVSRKSHIGACTGIGEPRARDAASALCAAAALRGGARVARVHDVAATASTLARSRRAVVALGSNEGDRVATLDAAVAALRRAEGVWVGAVSPYYESEPAYYEDQAPFANAVAVVETLLSPAELLDALHAVEDAHGRVRRRAYGPRTLDLDIVDYEGVVSADPQLVLPHPRALERDFVVTPLSDLLPGHVLADGAPLTREHVRYGKVTGKLAGPGCVDGPEGIPGVSSV